MPRALCTAVLLSALASPLGVAQEWATKMFPTSYHEFGTVARNAKAEFVFPITNSYVEDVHIAAVRSSCGCTTPTILKDTLKTYETGGLLVHLNTDRFQGQRGATLTVTIDKPFYAEVQVQVSGYIRSDVLLTPDSVQLGDVDQGQAATRTLNIQYAGRRDWQIVGVKASNPHVQASVAETARRTGLVGYQLTVKLDEQAPVGSLGDRILLITNDPSAPQIPVQLEGRVLSAITVTPGSLFMGTVRPGEKVTRQLVVRGKAPFRILSVNCEDPSFAFGQVSEEAKTLHMIPVTFEGGETAGKVARKIRIVTDLGEATTPELPAFAVVATP